MRYGFLVETYETERLKVLGVWSMFRDEDLPVRPHATDRRGRSVHEQMVHQCVSEDLWFRTMLGIGASVSALPEIERRLDFIERYAASSAERLDALRSRPESWWEGETRFFDTTRSRAWGRRPAHRAHVPPSRPADGNAPDAQPRPAQQLRADLRYGWIAPEPRTGGLRLPGSGGSAGGRARGRTQGDAPRSGRTAAYRAARELAPQRTSGARRIRRIVRTGRRAVQTPQRNDGGPQFHQVCLSFSGTAYVEDGLG